MVRTHRETPKPKDLTPLFDTTDVPAQEIPKPDPKKKPPVSVEAMRPKRAKKPVEEESPYEEIKIEGGEIMPLRTEVQELGKAYENARADFEQVTRAITERKKFIRAWAEEESVIKSDKSVEELEERILMHEGLDDKLDAAIDRIIETRKAYEEAYERWEKEDEEDRKDLDDLVKRFLKTPAPKTEEPGLMPRQSPEEEKEAQERFAYNMAHPLLTEEEAEAKRKSTAEQDEWDAKIHEAKRKVEAEPMDRLKEAEWYGEGEVASREAQALADVRQEIAGDEMEQPIGAPSDLSALGFDQVFIDAYRETQERFDKLDEQRRKAGFFKKLFGGARLEREHEAARSDLESMQEEVAKRRMGRERGVQESKMTPAQREAKRKGDEAKMRGIVRRGH